MPQSTSLNCFSFLLHCPHYAMSSTVVSDPSPNTQPRHPLEQWEHVVKEIGKTNPDVLTIVVAMDLGIFAPVQTLRHPLAKLCEVGQQVVAQLQLVIEWVASVNLSS